jgi:hypothetical protein
MRALLTSASYTAQSLKANAQRCVNLYPEANSPDSTAPTTFYHTPGLKLWSTMPGTGPVRCLFRASNGHLFARAGREGVPLRRHMEGARHTHQRIRPGIGCRQQLYAVFVDGTPMRRRSSWTTTRYRR